MKLILSWLREFVDVKASADDVASTLALRGFEVASIQPLDGGDAVIDFEVTANRPDALSVIGLAREVATAYNLPLVPSASTPAAGSRLADLPTGASNLITVSIEDEELCPRYAAAVANVRVGPSPAWLAGRLQAAGVRPISNIVDITNYVNLERGQPMHAFDLARLAGREIHARRARPGETIVTLDGIARTLEADMLVIADRDRAQAVGGVMGGADSEVSSTTGTVVFESAYFKPASVRRTSKRLGLKTEASSRFERGGDVNGQVVAIQRAIALMQQIGAGEPVGPIVDVYPRPQPPRPLHLRRERLARVLGASVPDAEVTRILRGLGLEVVTAGDGWDAKAPTFRVDLLREADLIEETGRHYGFDKLEATFPVVTQPAPAPDPRIHRDRLVRRVLERRGFLRGRDLRIHRGESARGVHGPGPHAARATGTALGGFTGHGAERGDRHRQPALRQVRHAAAGDPARPGRRRRPQPPPRAARRPAVRARHAVRGARGNARRGLGVDRRGRR